MANDEEVFFGEIRMFAGTIEPQNRAFCDGRTLPCGANLPLASLISGVYGPAGGNMTLPDLRGRVPIGSGSGPGLTPRTCGEALGVEKVSLSEAELPKHVHRILLSAAGKADKNSPQDAYLAPSEGFSAYAAGDAGAAAPLDAAALQPSAGRAEPHENMMPSCCVNFLIALRGIYPPRS